MLVYRSVVVGLLAACCLLVARRQRIEVRMAVPAQPHVSTWGAAPPQIIDVAPLIAPGELAKLLRLAPAERVVAVDDTPTGDNFEAGALLARLDVGSQRYVDLTVTGPLGERRVLVLMH
jgi:hypothetical protein